MDLKRCQGVKVPDSEVWRVREHGRVVSVLGDMQGMRWRSVDGAWWMEGFVPWGMWRLSVTAGGGRR
jgi:hypothetical protein